jgi:hypothetical protein
VTSTDLPIVPIGVKNAPFTLDLIARDCPPLQFLREFTRNGIEAIEAYRAEVDPDYRGQVIWTYDRNLYDLEGLKKLACIDTGIGMSAGELPEFVNELAASGKEQGLELNFGIGAKVSAAGRNPQGVIYCSWRDGKGSMVELGRDAAGQWGMRRHRLSDGSVVAVVPLEDAAKPPEIMGLDHGTMVVFLGEFADQDTTLAPPEAENKEKWIAKALNQRFFDVPEYVEVKAREVKLPDEEFLRTIRGQQHYLDLHTSTSGTLPISGARVHWRILDEDHRERGKQAGIWASTGHRAALLDGELYELATAARGGYQRVQDFGIVFGYERVVLYIEPDTGGRLVTPDTARTRVLIDGQALPWELYAEEFEAKMPPELRAFQEEIAAGSRSRDHSKAIRERLEALRDLFRISRYKPTPNGEQELDERNIGGKPRERNKQTKKSKRPSGTEGGRAGSVYALFERRGGTNGDEVDSTSLPEIARAWVTVKDGTRTPPHLEDRAARFDPRHNRLEINGDFRGYRDLVDRWTKRYARVPGATTIVEDTIAGWWEQALIETVLGVLALRGSEYWDETTIRDALSEVSLTAAVAPRYHLEHTLKRELGNRLGALKAAA